VIRFWMHRLPSMINVVE